MLLCIKILLVDIIFIFILYSPWARGQMYKMYEMYNNVQQYTSNIRQIYNTMELQFIQNIQNTWHGGAATLPHSTSISSV